MLTPWELKMHEYNRPERDMNSQEQQALAWEAVSHVLHEVSPGWTHNSKSGAEAAVDAIRALAQRPSPEEKPIIRPAVWDGTIRFDSDCIVNGVEIKAGTVWRAGDVVLPQSVPTPEGEKP